MNIKLFIVISAITLISAVGAFGTDIDQQIAVTNLPISVETLEELGLDGGEILEFQSLQDALRTRREESGVEMNVLKAEIARALYHADNAEREVFGLLEEAGDLRLELEKAQVRTYLGIRNLLGEDRWAELVKMARQMRGRQAAADRRTAEETPRR